MALTVLELHRNKYEDFFEPQNPRNTVYGQRLGAGTIIQADDLYDSTTGAWEPNAQCIGRPVPEGEHVVWVRPYRARD